MVLHPVVKNLVPKRANPRVRARWVAFLKRVVLHPVRLVPLAYLCMILIGTLLLMLPAARTAEAGDGFMPALFTAVSAVCVTGLITVDTPTFWTPFGHTVIIGLIQVGGFGIMSLGTLLALMLKKKVGLHGQLVAQSETHTLNLGDVREVLFRVARIMLLFEGLTALLLTGRFWLAYEENPLTALWYGVFHAISAFNNAGFALYSDNLMGFAQDPWIIIPICLALVIGGLGFPVLIELRRQGFRLRTWTVHARLTLFGAIGLLAIGSFLFGAIEWNRGETLGGFSPGGKLLASLAGGTFPRTAGFNSIDYAAAAPETLLITDILMFIGGGSAGTAGGIKIATFLVLAYAIWNEVRGNEQVNIAHRSISSTVQRQALAVALLGVAVVIIGTLLLLTFTDHGLDKSLFEATSAFATVGLSAGITPSLPTNAQLVLIVMMFLGRIGTVTVSTALALSLRSRLFRLPEERPIIG